MARKPPSKFKMAIITFAGYWFLRLLTASLRKEFVNTDHDAEALAKSKHGNAIYAVWHGRIILSTCTHRNQGLHVLVSLHRDGEIIARIAERLGYPIIRGSTTRGGAKALRTMLSVLEQGNLMAITPDGPKGPRFSVNDGCLFLAQKSGIPIVPSGISASRFWQFRSWDGTIIPKPFSKIRFTFGEPLFIPEQTTPEQIDELKQCLRDRLLAATKEGDAAICKILPGYDPPAKYATLKQPAKESK